MRVKWHGRPGHFICAYNCCFRMHTTVGEYRVSTVGCYHYNQDMADKTDENRQTLGAGKDDFYETMVFRNDAEGEMTHPELEQVRYATEEEAEAGHMAMIAKYLEMP